MLNTVMALWNQNPGANRQRIVKVLCTILLIIGSTSLLLFTLNSSAWSSFAGAKEQQIIKEKQPTISNAHGIVIAGNTPISDVGTASITPTATASSRKVPGHSPSVQVPAVVAQQRTTTGSLGPVPYAGKSSLGNGYSERRHIHPKALSVKNGKRHSTAKPAVKAPMTPALPITKPVPVASPVSPMATPAIQPIVVPTATATTTIQSPPDGTTDSNLPAIVTTGVTPDESMTQ